MPKNTEQSSNNPKDNILPIQRKIKRKVKPQNQRAFTSTKPYRNTITPQNLPTRDPHRKKSPPKHPTVRSP